MVTKKKQKKDLLKLKPTMIQQKENDLGKTELLDLAKSFSDSKIVLEDDKDKNIFVKVVQDMNDPKNISMKTEYLSVRENFAGVKLEFLARYGNMPYLDGFVETFETKRVSLHRKGRQEDVLILQERRAEEQRTKLEDFAKLFNAT